MSDQTDNREIDLQLLIVDFWKRKLMIVSVSILFSVAAVLLSFNAPILYKSQTVLQPVSADGGGAGLSSMASQFGGLADLAGINLGGGGSNEKVVIELLRSRKFILDIVQQQQWQPLLIAANGWNSASDTLVYDQEIYDPELQKWYLETDNGDLRQPTDKEIIEVYLQHFGVSLDQDSGLVTLYFSHYSPNVAKTVLDAIVRHINLLTKNEAASEAQDRIFYLQQNIEKTNVESIRSIFYQLIESELQQKMLIDTKKDYSFKTIDPAFVPEDKYTPKRLNYLVIGFILGLFVCVIWIFIRLIVKNYRGL